MSHAVSAAAPKLAGWTDVKLLLYLSAEFRIKCRKALALTGGVATDTARSTTESAPPSEELHLGRRPAEPFLYEMLSQCFSIGLWHF